MTQGKRWWWWAAIAGTAMVLLGIALSFRWIVGWSDSAYRVFIYFEHGMLCANPNAPPPGTLPGSVPWYGAFEAFRSPIYEPWRLFPIIQARGPGQWSFKVPLHLSLLILVPAVVYPLLPTVVRANRRKRGLCVKCGYDLTGNESGVCPECGTKTPRYAVLQYKFSVGPAVVGGVAVATITFVLTGPFLGSVAGEVVPMVASVSAGVVTYKYLRRPVT